MSLRHTRRPCYKWSRIDENKRKIIKAAKDCCDTNLQDEDWEDEGEEGEIEDDNEEWDDHDEFE